MDVTQTSLPDIPTNVAVKPGSPSQQGAASLASETLTALADRVDIQPLDVAAALQILLAEVRANLGLPAASAAHPAQTPQVLLTMLLQALPEDTSHPQLWAAALNQVYTTFQAAIARGVEVVMHWRDVPQAAVEAAKETQDLVLRQLNEEPPNPLWLRPEWLGLAAPMARFRRRRRLARRLLTDPDFRPRPEELLRDTDDRPDEPS